MSRSASAASTTRGHSKTSRLACSHRSARSFTGSRLQASCSVTQRGAPIRRRVAGAFVLNQLDELASPVMAEHRRAVLIKFADVPCSRPGVKRMVEAVVMLAQTNRDDSG